jgi:hypothetical protein
LNFSEKQYLFATYLLKKIGFIDVDLINKYLNKLEIVNGRFYMEYSTKRWPNGTVSEYSYLRYSVSECIEVLLKEIEIKRNIDLIKIIENNKNTFISATDLASFNFCPVSYSILKSFEIEFLSNENNIEIGINLHESLRLINKIFPANKNESDFINFEVLENEKINKIKNCQLIFAGHSNQNIYFKNFKNNFIGQPDYIFRDPNNKYFVVEEKFKYLNRNSNTTEIAFKNEILKKRFYSNHIIQVQSYIENITEYQIEYGVLIYWFYDKKNDLPNIHSVSIKVIKKGEFLDLLEKTNNDLLSFLDRKKIVNLPSFNPKKCAACSVNKYCGHKTNTKQELSFPYKLDYLNLEYVDFPNDLKKES